MAKTTEKVELGTTLAVGDQGIWVTYARGMKYKAIREFKELCIEVRASFDFDVLLLSPINL